MKPRDLIVLSLIILCSFSSLAQPVAAVANVSQIVMIPPTNGFYMGSLGYECSKEYFALAANTNNTASYTPSTTTLGSNTLVWTYPMDLSCIGYGTWGGQTVLVGSNLCVGNAHLDTNSGGCGVIYNPSGSVSFTGTNGVSHAYQIATVICGGPDDVELFTLVSAVDIGINPAWVFPASVTNNFIGHTVTNLPIIYPHQNTTHLDARIISDFNGLQMDTGIFTGQFFAGIQPTSGDSGSPLFTVVNGKTILLLTLHLANGQGDFVSSQPVWNFMNSNNVISELKQIDLSGFNTY